MANKGVGAIFPAILMMKSRFKMIILVRIASLAVLITLLVMGRLAVADEIYDACVSEAETGLYAGACAGSYYERLDGRLDRLWQKLLARYTQEEDGETLEEHDLIVLEHLRDEQEKWEAYRKTACSFHAATYQIEGTSIRIFGSMGTQYSFPACHGRIIEQRIEILRRHLCDFGSEDDVCP